MGSETLLYTYTVRSYAVATWLAYLVSVIGWLIVVIINLLFIGWDVEL